MLQEGFAKSAYIAGGAIVSSLQDETIHDYDVFFKEAEFNRNFLFHAESGSLLMGNPGLHIHTRTANAVTIHNESTGEVYQCVIRFTGPPERVFTTFDWEHCKAYFDPVCNSLFYNEDLIKNKKLVYTGEDNYPVNAASRLVKYVRRGYTIDKTNLLNLITKLSETNLKDADIMREQLIGFYGSALE